MSDLQLQSSVDTDSDRVKLLVDSLPTHFPKRVESENYQFFGAVGEFSDGVVSDLQDVQIATKVQKADSIDELAALGALVDRKPHVGESLEHYRTRLLAAYQNISSEGTISNLINNAAYILDISPRNVGYTESDEPGLIILGLPKTAVDDAELGSEEIITLLEENIAAGYYLQSLVTGTLEFINPTDYSNGNHDATEGYDGLDTNGDPKDNGGTYSTTMN